MSKFKLFTAKFLSENRTKIDIACGFVWYHYVTTEKEISVDRINEYFVAAHLPKYNTTYLKEALRKSKVITKGETALSYKPQRKYLDELSVKYSFVIEKSEEVVTDDIIIPDSLAQSTRGYIELLSKQINACYNHNIFDGCAVLMRRLLEILLIHSYEASGRVSDISEGDGFKNLSYIINHSTSNKPFPLTKEVIETLDDFRQLGNFSAHKTQYNCKRKDIDNIRLKYRLTIEELLYQSKIRK